MYGFYDKKNLNLIVLRILWELTDENHRLQQQEIVSLLKTQYGMGDLTKEGHLRHPLYLSNDCKIEPFEIK